MDELMYEGVLRELEAVTAAQVCGVRSHCRFGKQGTEPPSVSAVEGTSGGARRPCDRTGPAPQAAQLGVDAAALLGAFSAEGAPRISSATPIEPFISQEDTASSWAGLHTASMGTPVVRVAGVLRAS